MKKPPKISLLLADVDGTLVTHDKVLTARTRAAVQHLRQAGIRFALTSARPPKGLAMLIEPLAVDLPIAAFNGGCFVNPDLTVIEEHVLASDIARQSIDLILRHDLDVWVYTRDEWFLRDAKAPHAEREAWIIKFGPKPVERFDAVLDNVFKVVGVSDDYDRVRRCEADAHATLGDRAAAACSQPYYLDITHRDANKGRVLDYFARTLDIPKEEIATIGDQPVDVLMFERSGFSIAMCNASDEVKQKADAVTDSNEDEGFAKALEHFLLAASVNEVTP